MINERTTRRALIMITLAGLSIGLAAAFAGHNGLARWIWAAGTSRVLAVIRNNVFDLARSKQQYA
jgi:hypothetical protein